MSFIKPESLKSTLIPSKSIVKFLLSLISVALNQGKGHSDKNENVESSNIYHHAKCEPYLFINMRMYAYYFFFWGGGVPVSKAAVISMKDVQPA